MNVLPDFREPDNIRLGLSPLYFSFGEVWEMVDRLRLVVTEKRYLQYSSDRPPVT
jgi:kynureninase